VCANFYEDIANNLLEGALSEIKKSNYDYEIYKVDGVFEIPALIKLSLVNKEYIGWVTLGCVIRGETTHYDYVCGESARGINKLALKYNLPIGYGIITCENQEQALVRADINQKNVGGKSAKATLTMISAKNYFNSKV